jgi:hypothetical protein
MYPKLVLVTSSYFPRLAAIIEATMSRLANVASLQETEIAANEERR